MNGGHPVGGGSVPGQVCATFTKKNFSARTMLRVFAFIILITAVKAAYDALLK